MLYHISQIHGLKIVEPRKSTHGKSYVYAIEDLVTGLLFGVKKDDFDFIICTDEKGKPDIYECYPKAFELRYKSKSCSVYEVDDRNFKRGQTNWEPELVSDVPVHVIKEVVIDNIYDKLLEENRNGKLNIHYYKDKLVYKAFISRHIVDRLIRFDAFHLIKKDERFQLYYSKIISLLEDTMSGKYL